MRVRYLAQARADLASIWRYTAANWSVAQADTYLMALRTACTGVADGNRITRDASVTGPDLRVLTQGRHHIFLTIDDQEVQIIRILHQSRDVGRWVG